MKSFTFLPLMTIVLIALYASNLHSQSSQLLTANIVFESSNSLTFDLYIKNTGSSSWTYSHGSFAWTYNPSFLNGGAPSFSLVPGTSDFPSGGQPPSALLSSPSILRTSSNLPGSNGLILPGQALRISRFRLQTTAASFNGSTFMPVWKTSTTPYTRVFTWNSITGLPEEISAPNFLVDQLLLEENFSFSGLLNTNGWSIHSGTTNFISTTTGLAYSNYPGSGVGNAALISNLGGEDVNRGLISEVNTNGATVYFSTLINITESAASKSGDYFMHIGDRVNPTSFTLFSARVFAKVSNDTVYFGLSNTSTGTYNNLIGFSKNMTYLVVVKYIINTAGNDETSMWVIPSGIPASELEAGTPLITNTSTSGQDVIDAFGLRQGGATTSPQLIVDGIRVGLSWSDILPPPTGDPVLLTSPSTLSGFTYFQGSGPSNSLLYDLSGTNLLPLSGNIIVTAPVHYEVSLNNTTFSPSVNVSYLGGVLAATPVYVRLKAGLAAGTYNGELITNTGGGAAASVTCNGSVTKPEPSNHVTSFSGALGIPPYATINLNWNDATGATLPDGYLIKGSNRAFDSITVPIDGIPVANSIFAQNILPGVQTHEFTILNGGRTYYYKIFPYSNSGSLIDYKTDGTVPQFSITTSLPPSLPIIETFEYASGSLLTDNGWLAHSGAGTNSITVSPEPLLYTGYPLSGTGKSVNLVTSGEDANRAFDSIKTGSVYASFLVNVASAQTGDYFFHFGLENNTSLFFGKVFVKDSSGNIGFGIAKNQNTAVVYTPCVYSLNTTYIIVVKYSFNNGTTTDDEARLWINPVLNGIEPDANIIHTDAGTDAPALGMFALRQGSTSSAAVVNVSGIRIADSWIPSATGITLNLTAYIEGFWNGTTMVNDNVTIELRNSTSPFTLVEQQTISLNNAGTGSALFNIAANDVPYYIVVKHRNSIETWSALPQQFISGTMSYDFSAAAAQAFGNNLKLKNTKWCLYSGDVNQDGVIDLQDMADVDNSIGMANSPADVNGDGTVTSEDMNITSTNAQTFSSIKKPLNTPDAKINTENSKASID